MLLIFEPAQQRFDQPRLADAGLARDQQDAAVSRFSALPAPCHEIGLLLSTDEQRVRRAQRPKAIDDFAPFDDPPGFHRHREALERLCLDGRALEKLADETTRLAADDDGVGLCVGLKPRREVGRFADHVMVMRQRRRRPGRR